MAVHPPSPKWAPRGGVRLSRPTAKVAARGVVMGVALEVRQKPGLDVRGSTTS